MQTDIAWSWLFTRQERFLSEETDASGNLMLVERHRLIRPGKDDVVVDRMFSRDTSNKEDLTLQGGKVGTHLNPAIGELLTKS